MQHDTSMMYITLTNIYDIIIVYSDIWQSLVSLYNDLVTLTFIVAIACAPSVDIPII